MDYSSIITFGILLCVLTTLSYILFKQPWFGGKDGIKQSTEGSGKFLSANTPKKEELRIPKALIVTNGTGTKSLIKIKENPNGNNKKINK